MDLTRSGNRPAKLGISAADILGAQVALFAILSTLEDQGQITAVKRVPLLWGSRTRKVRKRVFQKFQRRTRQLLIASFQDFSSGGLNRFIIGGAVGGGRGRRPI